MMDRYAWMAALRGVTDIHLTEGAPALVRRAGILEAAPELPGVAELEAVIPEKKRAAYRESGVCDCAFTAGTVRCRLHLYRAGGRRAAAIRLLPDLADLPPDGDGPWLRAVTDLAGGLVLVTGPTGSGKSTALARIVQTLCRRSCHIITVEDPPEYLFPRGPALVHQKEVGTDVASFADGVRDALREDPDVVVIGELRDRATMEAALTAAETGRLVLATLHDDSAVGAVGRIVHAFPAEREREVRAILAAVLRFAAAQVLCRVGERTLLLREILANTAPVAHLIRDGKDEQISSYMEMGRLHMRTFPQALARAGADGLTPAEQEALARMAERFLR